MDHQSVFTFALLLLSMMPMMHFHMVKHDHVIIFVRKLNFSPQTKLPELTKPKAFFYFYFIWVTRTSSAMRLLRCSSFSKQYIHVTLRHTEPFQSKQNKIS